MNLQLINTAEFLFDPKQKDFLSNFEKYDEFRIPEQIKHCKTEKVYPIDKQKVFTYIAVLYDIKSTLHKDYPYYPHRKYQAALLAGWEKQKNDAFDPIVEDIITGSVVTVNNAIVKYCLLQHNTDFMMYVSYSSVFAILNLRALTGSFSDNDIKNIEKIGKLINDLSVKIFGGEEVRSMKEALYSAAEKERIALKPEDIAEKLAAGDDPLNGYNPYGEGYMPEQHKFLGDE